MKKIFIPISIITITTLIIGNFIINTKETTQPEPIKIIFFGKSIVSDFWITIRRGIEVAAKDRGAEVEFIVPQDDLNLKEQLNRLTEDSNPKNIKGVIIASSNFNFIRNEMEKIYKSGIQVLAFDEPLNWENISGYISIDNESAGKFIAEEIINRQKTKLAIINSEVENKSSQIKEESLIKNLEGKAEIITIEHCDPSENDAYEKTMLVLKEYPQIEAIAALNLTALEGVVKAVYETKNEVKVFGLNNTNYLIDMMERDIVAALIVQPVFNMGFIAIDKTVDAIEGRKISKENIFVLYTVNKYNIYTTDNQRLLFPVK